MTDQQVVFGLHAVQVLLQKQSKRVTKLCILEARHDKKIETLLKLAHQQTIPIEYTSKNNLNRMTHDANHQGVVAICVRAKVYDEKDLPTLIEKIIGPPLVLVLDGIQDPHNLGACLRSADASGVNFVIAPKDKAVGLTPIVSKVASGALELIPFVQVTNLVRALSTLKENGLWIYGATANAKQTIYQATFKEGVAIVLGAEGKGLRRLTTEHCDVLVNIPMLGSVESLNVSVACGVILFEVVRQRLLEPVQSLLSK